jgi:hypothetical protein
MKPSKNYALNNLNKVQGHVIKEHNNEDTTNKIEEPWKKKKKRHLPQMG